MWVHLVSVGWLVLSANPYLERGRELFQSLRYPEALAQLEVARQVTTGTPDEQRETLDLLARTHAALGHVERAEAAYAELLVAHPDATLSDDASPKLAELFTRAKRNVYPEPYVKLERKAAPADRWQVKLIDPWRRVAEVTLFSRDAAQAWTRRPMERAGPLAVAEVSPGARALYVVASGAEGAELARLADPEHPFLVGPVVAPSPTTAVAVAVPAPVPAREHRMFPTLALGAAALATAGVCVVLGALSSSHESAAKDGSPGGAGYFASDAHALNSRAQTEAWVADGFCAGAVLSGGGAVLTWAF